jgi:glycosyltransferase involved in cell wall biosynthesis
VSKQPLRVTVLARSVYPIHPYGGLERHVFDLVRYLLARNVHVTLITRPPTTSGLHVDRTGIDDSLAHPALSTIYIPYWTFPFAGRRGTTIVDRNTAYLWFGWRAGRVAARLARDQQVDIVHGLGASSLGYAGVRPHEGGRRVPFIFNPQGLEEFGTTQNFMGRLKRIAYRPLQTAVRRCAAAADRVIATDRVLVAPVREHLDLPEDKVRIIPNAVDIETCESLGSPETALELRRRINLGPNDPLLLSVGRLEENKGFHVLADALGEIATNSMAVNSAQRNWKWALVGTGPYRGRLKRLTESLGLGSRVVFVGNASDSELHSWYRAATLFIHPTLYEGSSLVTLEAMVHRRAIVATRAGGLPDKVHDGVNGWLVSPGETAPLAAAVREALSVPDRLRQMGDQSRAIVENHFSWSVAVDKLLTVYQEVLPNKHVPQDDRWRT